MYQKNIWCARARKPMIGTHLADMRMFHVIPHTHIFILWDVREREREVKKKHSSLFSGANKHHAKDSRNSRTICSMKPNEWVNERWKISYFIICGEWLWSEVITIFPLTTNDTEQSFRHASMYGLCVCLKITCGYPASVRQSIVNRIVDISPNFYFFFFKLFTKIVHIYFMP